MHLSLSIDPLLLGSPSWHGCFRESYLIELCLQAAQLAFKSFTRLHCLSCCDQLLCQAAECTLASGAQ